MPWQPRVQQMLERLLDSGDTPEEVCRDCPELLAQVREHWQRLRILQAEINTLFPEPGSLAGPNPFGAGRGGPELPRIAGYDVQAELGRGGMGVVYRARHLRLNRLVALKMLLAGEYADAVQRQRFLREAEAVAGLRHPNIVPVHDVGDHEGRPYFTMELVEGGTLAEKLSGRPQPAQEAATLVATLAGAMEAAHRSGIVHRDLKPANVLLTSEGTPKITDFGLARRLGDGVALTQSGAMLGTPSHMAPEQVQSKAHTIGPAADVYALGAILYECLTGRPPFVAETSTEILLYVIAREPIPPSSLNAQVPRDLETICLKCLHKEPHRRYASAAALAKDLQRFLRGETIAAGRTGPLQRLGRRVRRYPAQAALVAGVVLLTLVLVGGAGCLIGQRMVTERAVEAELREVVRLQQESAFPEASAALERARFRLGAKGPAWLYPVLEEARRDQHLLVRLEAIRLERATFVDGRQNHAAELRFNQARADRDYEDAFRDRELCTPSHDPEGTADRLKASPLRAAMVAAFDDWAVCATDRARQEWLLRVARLADPDPWRDRVRDPAAWTDGAALAELARTAPLADQPLPFLLALGERLHSAGGDGIGFLRLVHKEHPDDFWTNFTLARMVHSAARQQRGHPAPALVYYQKALTLRPQALAVHNDLGLVLLDRFWLHDNPTEWGPGAVTVYRQALAIDPLFAPALNNLGFILKGDGKWDQAIPYFHDAVRINPRLAPAQFNLGEVQAGTGQLNEAIAHYRQALEIDPDFAVAHYHLGLALLAKGRLDEVDDSYPEGVGALAESRGLGLREVIEHYKRSQFLHPEWAAARNRLRMSPQDDARLNEAIDHYRQAIRIEPGLYLPYGALGQALLAKWQLGEAEAALRRSLELLPSEEKQLRANLEILRQRCRRLLALEGRLPAIVKGDDKPTAGECLEAAELCFVKQHYATAARLFVEALSANERLGADLGSGHRLNAARAAALAGCGGDERARLGESQRLALRQQARQQLRLDLSAWARKLDAGTAADSIQARRALSQWRQEPDLAGLREPAALDRVPPGERQECRGLWHDLDVLIQRAEGRR